MFESAGDQFPTLLNARASNPGHSYLRLLRRKCLLPSAPRVRLRTLNRTSYESRNAMTNEPTAARAASALRNFSIWDLRSSRRPPAHGMRRKDILLRAPALTAGKRNNCKHLFDIHTLDPSGNGVWLRYPKRTGQTPVRSLPRKENGKARTWMDEKSVRSLMAITSHLPKGWASERYSCSDSSACLRLRMR